jgi:hypothetical protein
MKTCVVGQNKLGEVGAIEGVDTVSADNTSLDIDHHSPSNRLMVKFVGNC